MKIGKNFQSLGSIDMAADIVTIGDNVVIGGESRIVTHCPIRMYKEKPEINIGNFVYLGFRCIVLPGVTIGDNCMVGAGSVISEDLPSNSICAGNPAKKIRDFKDEELERFQSQIVNRKVADGT